MGAAMEVATGSGNTAKNFAHHADELEQALVANSVVHPIGFFAGNQNTLVPQNGQVLGNVALRSADRINNFLNTSFFSANDAENFQAQGMGNRFKRASGEVNVFLLFDEIDGWSLHDKYSQYRS